MTDAEIKPTCQNCRHIRAVSGKFHSECHRFPPQVWVDPYGATDGTRMSAAPRFEFPPAKDPCGEWQHNRIGKVAGEGGKTTTQDAGAAFGGSFEWVARGFGFAAGLSLFVMALRWVGWLQ